MRHRDPGSTAGFIASAQAAADLPPLISKLPTYCNSPQELEPGDIVIFNMRPPGVGNRVDYLGYAARKQQGLINEKGGHKETVHAGFIVMHEGKMKLAHLVGEGFKLQEIDGDDKCPGYFNSTTHIYRPRKNRKELAEELAKLIPVHASENHKKNKKTWVKYSLLKLVRIAIHKLFESLKIMNHDPDNKNFNRDDIPDDRVMANQSMCTKFLADAYIAASHQLTQQKKDVDYRTRFMNISSLTLPKTLQAYLYRNTNYEYKVMPHVRNDVYNNIMLEIKNHMLRLQYDDLPASKAKAQMLSQAIENFEANDHVDNDLMKKSIRLLKAVRPILLINTRGHYTKPTSYKDVMRYARQQGIYEEYLTHDYHDRNEGKIKELAMKHYHYGEAKAKLYSRYCHIGYSDEEAKFECKKKPTFGEWFKLSPVRNIVLTCTGLGFLCWVLPRGLHRISQVEQRNKLHQLH